MWEIIQTVHQQDIEAAKSLVKEYTDPLGLNLDFQHLFAELQDFPSFYASPQGRVLLARHGNQIAGCICLRRLDDEVCEIKRLYVKPIF